MSFEPDNQESETTVQNQLSEIAGLLKAILIGIEIIADQEHGSLIEDIDGD